MGRRQDFREFLDRHDVVIAPGAHDAASARLIEAAGFPAVWASGFGIAYAQQFRADANLVTMVENAEAAAHIVEAVSCPVVADIDNGYGNAINVLRTIRRYVQAGVTAVELEDQVYPKRCGIFPGKQNRALISTAEMVGKLQAARDAAGDDIFLIARSDAFDTGHTLEQVLERLHAYVDAGADMVTAVSSHVADLRAYSAAWDRRDIPLMVAPTLMPDLTARDFRDMGFKLVIYSVHVLQAAISGMQYMLAHLKQHEEWGTLLADDRMISFATLVETIGLGELGQLESKYLPARNLQTAA
jgi:phosphoenolpyruvate phosphomutase